MFTMIIITSWTNMIARIRISMTIRITGVAMVARTAGTPMTTRGFFDY